MIKKVANNETNQEKLNLEPTEKVKEKLDYYRSLIPKLAVLTPEEITELKKDISIFFNLKPVLFTNKIPEHLFRISINNRILGETGLTFLTEISQLLAPPIDKCNFNRCSLPQQQILYCATDEMTAYWETKPKKGDVITISLFKAKPNAKINCAVIESEFKKQAGADHHLMEIFHLLNEFFIEVFTMPVGRINPVDYLFSATLSSEQLFYPIKSAENIEAIIYPSVQRKMKGHNFAIKNELIFEKYDLVDVTTRFIIKEIDGIDPHSNERPIDDLISSITIKEFDFVNGKIKVPTDLADRFDFFRYLQLNGSNQVRFTKPLEANDFLKTLQNSKNNSAKEKEIKYKRNDKVTVMYYNNDPVKKAVKYKFVERDILDNKCMVIKHE